MLKKQVAELSNLSIENHSKNEELEQYGRCLCFNVAYNHVKEIRAINFCCADVNCRLRVSFTMKNKKIFFSRRFKSCVISLIMNFKYTLFYLFIILILQN